MFDIYGFENSNVLTARTDASMIFNIIAMNGSMNGITVEANTDNINGTSAKLEFWTNNSKTEANVEPDSYIQYIQNKGLNIASALNTTIDTSENTTIITSGETII